MGNKALIVPIINDNGTRKSELMEQYKEACYLLGKAKIGLLACAPNGRDYYQEPGLLKKAILQHCNMVNVLIELQDEIRDVLEGIDSQDTNDK